jgi:endonuclease/exonuclease/phosphatase family metal-dependent hydrolase
VNKILYLLLLAALIASLWFFARPVSGVRVAELRPAEVLRNAPRRSADPSRAPRLRVATYNLEHFTDARFDGPDRTQDAFLAQARGAASVIAEADPDILVLQEIENARALRRLNAELAGQGLAPFPWAYVTRLPSPYGGTDKLNLALLSRVRPVHVRQLAFSRLDYAARPSRGSLCAEFKSGDGARLLVYAIHLKSNFGDPPANQAKRAIALHLIAADALSEAYRNQPDATATLILGDTNVDPDTPDFAADPSLRPLAGGYRDLWLGTPMPDRTTIPTRQPGDPAFVFPPSAFDRIFASHNLAPDGTFPWIASSPRNIQRGTATHDNTAQPGHDGHVSDHYLAYTDLLPRHTAEKGLEGQ